jgi:hypothetical protein
MDSFFYDPTDDGIVDIHFLVLLYYCLSKLQKIVYL